MSAATRYRQLPSTARAVGFELRTPSDVDVQPVDRGDTVVRCREQRAGKTVGELEVAVFRAALLIDRDGILEEKVREAIDDAADAGARVQPAVPIELPGASGFRAEAELVRGAPRPPLPYIYVLAIASNDLGLDGGVLVTVRCATPEWPAADAILKSLRILGRRGTTANDAADEPAALPMARALPKKDS